MKRKENAQILTKKAGFPAFPENSHAWTKKVVKINSIAYPLPHEILKDSELKQLVNDGSSLYRVVNSISGWALLSQKPLLQLHTGFMLKNK